MAHIVSGTATQAIATGIITIADTSVYDGTRANFALVLMVSHRDELTLVYPANVQTVTAFLEEPDTDGVFVYTLGIFNFLAANPVDLSTLQVGYHFWSGTDEVLYQVVLLDGVNVLVEATEIPEDWPDQAHIRMLNDWHNDNDTLDAIYADITGGRCPKISVEMVLLEKKRIAAQGHFLEFNNIEADRLLE